MSCSTVKEKLKVTLLSWEKEVMEAECLLCVCPGLSCCLLIELLPLVLLLPVVPWALGVCACERVYRGGVKRKIYPKLFNVLLLFPRPTSPLPF